MINSLCEIGVQILLRKWSGSVKLQSLAFVSLLVELLPSGHYCLSSMTLIPLTKLSWDTIYSTCFISLLIFLHLSFSCLRWTRTFHHWQNIKSTKVCLFPSTFAKLNKFFRELTFSRFVNWSIFFFSIITTRLQSSFSYTSLLSLFRFFIYVLSIPLLILSR